jgi:outer membrane lipoprotein-sorting protein
MAISGGRRLTGFIVFLGLFSGAFAQADAPRLEQMTAVDLNDLQATVKVLMADQKELAKINRDFGMAYRLKDMVMRYKDPDKLRMEGRIGLLIINGSTRFFKVPQLGYAKKDDLNGSPGKRLSLLDIGLLTRSGLADTESKFVRDETLNNVPVHVFDVAYRGDTTGHSLVWVDPRTRAILKREWYNGEGKLRATFLYENLREIKPGLWIPTRLEVRNGEGTVAAVTAYSDLKVNQGLDDALFAIS